MCQSIVKLPCHHPLPTLRGIVKAYARAFSHLGEQEPCSETKSSFLPPIHLFLKCQNEAQKNLIACSQHLSSIRRWTDTGVVPQWLEASICNADMPYEHWFKSHLLHFHPAALQWLGNAFKASLGPCTSEGDLNEDTWGLNQSLKDLCVSIKLK